MSTKMVYAVDDDATLRDLLEKNLRAAGYDVRTFAQGESFLAQLEHGLPDIALLDWMLPGMDGPEIASRIRANKLTRNLPVIMLTARDSEIDTIVGLEAGADDYISKPFSMRELTTRIRAILSRIERMLKDTASQPVLEAGGVRVDIAARRVWYRGGEVFLRLKEFELLLLLLQAKGRALTREYLLETVWGADYDGSTRTVDMHILQLRKRLYGGDEGRIETLRGVGYRFRDE